jgi:hypothetical protein
MRGGTRRDLGGGRACAESAAAEPRANADCRANGRPPPSGTQMPQQTRMRARSASLHRERRRRHGARARQGPGPPRPQAHQRPPHPPLRWHQAHRLEASAWPAASPTLPTPPALLRPYRLGARRGRLRWRRHTRVSGAGGAAAPAGRWRAGGGRVRLRSSCTCALFARSILSVWNQDLNTLLTNLNEFASDVRFQPISRLATKSDTMKKLLLIFGVGSSISILLLIYRRFQGNRKFERKLVQPRIVPDQQ